MDDRGDLKRKHQGHKTFHGPSRSVYLCGKIDKCRGKRRIADRHCHHRRRKINREELAKYGSDAIILGSSTCKQKRRTIGGGFPWSLSNRKGSGQTLTYSPH